MNRSFRAQEPQMQASLQRRQLGRNNLGTIMKEKEEELALFLEMQKREKERNNLLFQNSQDFDSPPGSKPGSSPIFKIVQSAPTRKTPIDDFLNSDNDKNDYDWLLTPPGTPLFPSLEMDNQKTAMNQIGTTNPRPTALKSRLANAQTEPASRSSLVSRQSTLSPGLNSSSAGTHRPSSSGGRSTASSRPSTPTGRPTLNATTKASRPSTPTSRPTLPSSKPVAPPARSRTPARSSTPTARPTLQGSKPTITGPKSIIPASRSTAPASRSNTPASRSTTPASRPTAPTSRSTAPASRSTTPASRSTVPASRSTTPASKSTSRSATPTRSLTAPSSVANVSARGRSASVTKSAPTTSKNLVPSRGSSPTVKSRPWNPSEMPGFSLEAPPNLRTTMPDRPVSASRGRPGAPSSRSASVEPGSTGRPRRQSCSPSRGRAPIGSIHSSGSSVPAVSRVRANGSDNVSPVQIGNKMVERVVNMRKLAPPKHDDHRSSQNNSSGKSSPDSTGFGRNLSKKSLDMALRHMDIRRSVPGSLRPMMTNIPASSMYSVRSGPVRSRTVSVSDSPLATSSNASSERSVNNNNALCFDGSDLEGDFGSERDGPILGDP